MTNYYDHNLKHWNEKARLHSSKSSSTYNIESFLHGSSTLLPIEKNFFKNVTNKKILHAQCHIGFDSISLARLGATVTAVDFSSDAITEAKKFADHLQIPVEFIQANIFDLPSTKLAKNSFDYIYASYGVLCWIDDINKWTRTLSSYLKPGGSFLLIDDHPYVNTLEFVQDKYEIKSNYTKNKIPFEFVNEYSYTGPEFKLQDNKIAYEWNHSIDEIISSFLKANVILTSFYEYEFTFWQRFSFLKQSSEGYYFKDSSNKNAPNVSIPLMFSLTAVKP